MKDCLSVIAEARCAIGHQSLALGRADCGTKIGFAAQAAFALAAFRSVKRNHMIAGLYRGDARAHLTNNPSTLMTEDRRKDSFAVESVKRVGVGVTDASCFYFNKDLAGFGAIQSKLDDFKRLFCLEGDSGASLHLSHLPLKDPAWIRLSHPFRYRFR